jgi:hypothetical protein
MYRLLEMRFDLIFQFHENKRGTYERLWKNIFLIKKDYGP